MKQLRPKHFISQQFEGTLAANPDFMRKFAKAYHSKAEKMDDGEVAIERKRGLGGWNHAATWKVSANGKEFFVKEIGLEDTCRWQRGHGLFLTMEALAALETENVLVARPQFGILARKTSFFVEKYFDLPVAEDVLNSVPHALQAEFRIFREAAEKRGFIDVGLDNSFFDQKNGKLIVFDAMCGI